MTVNVTKPAINLREKLSELDFDKVPFQKMPSGSVLQVVDSGAQTTGSTSQSTTFIDGNCTATITPISASSKIIVMVTQTIQVWQSGSPYATGRWKIQRNVGGGAFSDIYIDYSPQNGNIFAYDYGGSGINIYRPTSYTMVDSPSTTSAVIYKTQIAKGSNGGNRIEVNTNSPGRMILMEIAV
jgi:hypothetical protein